jgi:hypothetical protein
LPYRERSIATQPWYLAGDMTMFDPTNWAVEEWDLALKTAVQSARLIECRKTGSEGCEATHPMWTGQQDDNDEAVRIAHDYQVCERAVGWEAGQCLEHAREAVRELARARGNENDPGTLAIADVVTLPSAIVLCHGPVASDDHPACGRRGSPRPATSAATSSEHRDAQVRVRASADGGDPVTGEKSRLHEHLDASRTSPPSRWSTSSATRTASSRPRKSRAASTSVTGRPRRSSARRARFRR